MVVLTAENVTVCVATVPPAVGGPVSLNVPLVPIRRDDLDRHRRRHRERRRRPRRRDRQHAEDARRVLAATK